MAAYIDTSCFLKLLFVEPESEPTSALVADEDRVVVSSLTRLETVVRVQWRLSQRQLTRADAAGLLDRLDTIVSADPFEFRHCPADLMEEAEKQVQPVAASTYCRTLDRLHLATVTAFGLKRLFTNDDAQAQAARAIGLKVIMPR